MKAIVQAYRALGCVVRVTNDTTSDILVQYGGMTDIVEIKDGTKSPSRRKLTPAQVKLHDTLMIRIVTGLDQVADHVSVLRKRHQWLMQMQSV